MEEERRSQEERQLEDDERLARLLSEELVCALCFASVKALF